MQNCMSFFTQKDPENHRSPCPSPWSGPQYQNVNSAPFFERSRYIVVCFSCKSSQGCIKQLYPPLTKVRSVVYKKWDDTRVKSILQGCGIILSSLISNDGKPNGMFWTDYHGKPHISIAPYSCNISKTVVTRARLALGYLSRIESWPNYVKTIPIGAS